MKRRSAGRETETVIYGIHAVGHCLESFPDRVIELLVAEGDRLRFRPVEVVRTLSDEVVIGVNGVFGTRMCDVAARCGAKVIKVEAPWGQIIEPEPIADARGFFARTFCREEFSTHGLNPELRQCSLSFNTRKGTLRGMHYQVAPYAEAKLMRCIRGAMYDVIVDLRPGPCQQFSGFRRLHFDSRFHQQLKRFVEDTIQQVTIWLQPRTWLLQ